MPDSITSAKATNEDALRRLREAFSNAQAFGGAKLVNIIPSADDLKKRAEEELSFGRVIIGDDDLSTGMTLHVVQPVLDVIAAWKRIKSAFDGMMMPFVNDVDAMDKLDSEIVQSKIKREAVKDQIEKRADSDANYEAAKKHKTEAEIHFTELKDREGRRPPNLATYSFLYWIGLASILGAEILINYRTFLFFLGVPAIAAGTTFLMGMLLAFAAHKHGGLLKQGHYLFARHVSRAERASEWRAFAFATFGLILVIGTAAASRYEYVMHIIITQSGGSILGSDARIEVNPLKDVSLSLMGNVAAWAVGVLLSYFCHDKSPEFAEAAHEANRTQRVYRKVRAQYDDEIATEEAKLQRDIEQLERSAMARVADVAEPRDMRRQIEICDDSVFDACLAALRKGADQYRGFLLQGAISQPTAVQLLRAGNPLTPYEYQAVKLMFNKESLVRLAQ